MLEIAQKLDKLSLLHEQAENLESEKRQLIDNLLSPEIRARIEEIEDEFAGKSEAADEAIAALEEEIRADTLAHGATVKASGFSAIWSRGRVLWDSKGLAEYAVTHAEVLQYRKHGEPIVTLRRVQAKEIPE